MATRQNADYGHDIQKLYIEMLLGNAETFVRCQGIWDPQLFDKKLQPAAAFLKNYVDEHNVIPTPAIVNAATGQNFSIPEGLQEQHYDWLLNEFETFIRHKGLEKAILEAADMLEKGEYGTVEEKIKKAVQVGLQKDLGTDYFADPRARLLKIKDNNGQMSTGWAALDEKLYGGANRGELWIFGAASGGGKSLFLANLAINYALQGKNTAYITLELSEELVAMRIDSMLTGVSTREVFKQIDDVEMKVKVIGKKAGSIQIKYMPSGKTANDIRAYMKEYEVKTGKKIDVLLIDYLDLLMPAGHKVSAENLYIKDKYVSEELRNVAMEKKCVVLTAAQFNRSAVDEVEFDHSHISGGLSKIQTADAVFGIFTSRAMRERGKYQLQFLKTRNSSGVGQKIDLNFDVDTLRITNSDEQSDDSYSPTTQKSSQILNTLQRTSTVGADASDTKVPKAEVGSTKLRALLNNMPNDF